MMQSSEGKKLVLCTECREIGAAQESGRWMLIVANRDQRCGNGIVEQDEQCDDGNLADGDGCNTFCRIEKRYVCTRDPVFSPVSSCEMVKGKKWSEKNTWAMTLVVVVVVVAVILIYANSVVSAWWAFRKAKRKIKRE